MSRSSRASWRTVAATLGAPGPSRGHARPETSGFARLPHSRCENGASTKAGKNRQCRYSPGAESLRDDGRMHSRSEEHTSELQSLMRISYAVLCLKKKKKCTEVNDKHTKCAQTPQD